MAENAVDTQMVLRDKDITWEAVRYPYVEYDMDSWNEYLHSHKLATSEGRWSQIGCTVNKTNLPTPTKPLMRQSHEPRVVKVAYTFQTNIMFMNGDACINHKINTYYLTIKHWLLLQIDHSTCSTLNTINIHSIPWPREPTNKQSLLQRLLGRSDDLNSSNRKSLKQFLIIHAPLRFSVDVEHHSSLPLRGTRLMRKSL